MAQTAQAGYSYFNAPDAQVVFFWAIFPAGIDTDFAKIYTSRTVFYTNEQVFSKFQNCHLRIFVVEIFETLITQITLIFWLTTKTRRIFVGFIILIVVLQNRIIFKKAQRDFKRWLRRFHWFFNRGFARITAELTTSSCRWRLNGVSAGEINDFDFMIWIYWAGWRCWNKAMAISKAAAV